MLSLNGYSQQRWNALLSKAHSEDVTCDLVAQRPPNDGLHGPTYYAFSASSSSDPYRRYTTSLHLDPSGRVQGECTCQAHQSHSLCKHLALAVDSIKGQITQLHGAV